MSAGEAKPGDTFRPGDLLNNTYRIERILGRGGTSEVYRARSEISGRVVALKVLRSEFSSNEDYLALMTREEDIREIRHDAIVRYFDNQRTDSGLVYLVMDYVDGPGLDRKLAQGGMSADDLLTVARRVAEGLGAAHARQIVHRDLSPDNIILRDGDPADAVIIDFGIAKDANPGAETIVGGDFAGKFAYAAPEQLAGQADARSDIYALGALLLATYRGKPPDIGNNLSDVVRIKAEPLDTSGVPEPLKGLIDRMTAPDPADRFQTTGEVLGALAAGDQTDDIDPERTVIAPPRPKTHPPGAGRTVPPAAPPDRETPPPQPAATRAGDAGRRRRGGLIAALFALLLVAGGALWVATGGAPFGPRYAEATPFTLTAEKTGAGEARATGFVPSPDVRDALAERIAALGGTADLTLARGAISQTWGADLLALIDLVQDLPEWRIETRDDFVRLTGLAEDTQQKARLTRRLSQDGMPGALDGEVQILAGPRILSPARVNEVITPLEDCGPLRQVDPPSTGYPLGAEIVVSGQVASAATRAELGRALSAAAGERRIVPRVTILNPGLCIVDRALPQVPGGDFDIDFGWGGQPGENVAGRYLVGENPVIDVTIPAEVTTGYLFVSALDVSGRVFHMLPNLNRKDNSVESLRDGRGGPVELRVAYSLDEAEEAGGRRLAFVVDDTALGKTRILVLHSETPIFSGLRPTMESAEGFAEALGNLDGAIRTLDSRILTTAEP
ncbi:serine/threonine protein kinase [Rhodosalinus halophilus]|uniref:Serine/threonine protein kinase n=1 Tax=Rhodosalinus halophilus TaxID=2259333 RepID=A0A365UEW1_9RHOB|nr:serine/threonine-protein kinase [Rhodosalinus halophilus]RBI87383.1 serine/threonine protein kinase [Rhodosalinus halophilus]